MNNCGYISCDRCWLRTDNDECPFNPYVLSREVLRHAKEKSVAMIPILRKAFIESAEKQVPIPPRVEAKVEEVFKYWYSKDGTKHLNITRKAFCQNCGKQIKLGILNYSRKANYCPHCGQKIWWASNKEE